MADYLLQEGSQLDGLILIRLGQVDVLQIKHLSCAFLRPKYLPRTRVDLHANLVQLLDDMIGIGLRVTVHGSKIYLGSLPQFHEGLADQHALAAPLATNHYEVLIALHPILKHGEVALNSRCLEDCPLLGADLIEREL